MPTVEEIREFGDNTEHLSNGLLGPHRTITSYLKGLGVSTT